MNTPKHTPGPWKILKGHTGLTWFVIFKTRETRQRAEAAKVFIRPRLVKSGDVESESLASVDSTCLNFGANKDANLLEAEANARLIAAAPEMLRALEVAKEACRDFPHAWQTVNAAIKLAKGDCE